MANCPKCDYVFSIDELYCPDDGTPNPDPLSSAAKSSHEDEYGPEKPASSPFGTRITGPGMGLAGDDVGDDDPAIMEWFSTALEFTEVSYKLDEERKLIRQILDRSQHGMNAEEGGFGEAVEEILTNQKRLLEICSEISEVQDKASECLQRVLEIDPCFFKAWWLKAVNETGRGDAQEAVKSLKRFIELAPPEAAELVAKARGMERKIRASYGDHSRTGADVTERERRDRIHALISRMDPVMGIFLKLNESVGEEPCLTSQALYRLLKKHGRAKLLSVVAGAVSGTDGRLQSILSRLNEAGGGNP